MTQQLADARYRWAGYIYSTSTVDVEAVPVTVAVEISLYCEDGDAPQSDKHCMVLKVRPDDCSMTAVLTVQL